MKLILALVVIAVLAACDDDGTLACTDADCQGLGSVQVQLVGENDAPVAARGEYRITGRGGDVREPVVFDCAGAAADAGPLDDACPNGTLGVAGTDHPNVRVDIRFELTQGGLTEWMPISLIYQSHTDPDFNGPGCSCTSYRADARSFSVPDGARRPFPG